MLVPGSGTSPRHKKAAGAPGEIGGLLLRVAPAAFFIHIGNAVT